MATSKSPSDNADSTTNPSSLKDKIKDLHPFDILKALGGLVVLIPLFTIVFQYRETSQQNADQNYRTLVAGLSSVNKEDRLAAATNLGTFITKGIWGKGSRYDETIDILVNRISVELDYNVINAIHGSLMRISANDQDEFRTIIEKLLSFDRDFFVQERTIRSWQDSSKKDYDDIEGIYYRYSDSKIDTAIMNNKGSEMRKKFERFYNDEKNRVELRRHEQTNANFISMLLDLAHTQKLEFSRNALNGIVIHNAIFDEATIGNSAMSSSVLKDVQFNKSEILNTTFYGSDLTNSQFTDCKISASLFDFAVIKNVDFANSELTDVFFTGSDLSNADFSKCKGLKPIYFYKADSLSLTKAKFDSDFRKQLNAAHYSDDDFMRYLDDSSSLSSQKIDYLIKDISELAAPDNTLTQDSLQNQLN